MKESSWFRSFCLLRMGLFTRVKIQFIILYIYLQFSGLTEVDLMLRSVTMLKHMIPSLKSMLFQVLEIRNKQELSQMLAQNACQNATVAYVQVMFGDTVNIMRPRLELLLSPMDKWANCGTPGIALTDCKEHLGEEVKGKRISSF